MGGTDQQSMPEQLEILGVVLENVFQKYHVRVI